MNRILSDRLAARASHRQIDAIIRADQAGDYLDSLVHHRWQELLAAGNAPFQELEFRLRQIPLAIMAGAVRVLRGFAVWGEQSARDSTISVLPEIYQEKLRKAYLLEDAPRAGAIGVLSMPPPAKKVSKKRWDELKKDLLFPPLPPEKIDRILSPLFAPPNWPTTLGNGNGNGHGDRTTHDLATQMIRDFSQGKSNTEVARAIRPYVDDSRVRARRLARTFGLYVSHQTQLLTWEQMGTAVLGYQIHATLDSHTRPWHASRNGTIYYKQPGPDQKGLEQMPHPPQEARDPAERPAGEPQIAWNCRCFLSPVMVHNPEIANDPAKTKVFMDAQDKLIPDPVDYAEWFQGADERRQRIAVGSARFSAVVDRLPSWRLRPAWEDFLDPETGDLLPMEDIENETELERQERIARVKELLARRKELIRRVATFGFLAG